MYVERAAEGANEADGPFSAASPVVPSARMSDNVTLARDGAIATVTLNRPDRRNSLSDPMLTDLAAAFAELRDDGATRVVIVTGAPPVFSAGGRPRPQTGVAGRESRAGVRP